MRVLDLLFLVMVTASIVWNGWHWHAHRWLASAWVSAWYEYQWEHCTEDPETLRLYQNAARDARAQIPNGLVAICMKDARERVARHMAAKGG